MISYGVAFTSFAASSDLTNSDFVRRASISQSLYTSIRNAGGKYTMDGSTLEGRIFFDFERDEVRVS